MQRLTVFYRTISLIEALKYQHILKQTKTNSLHTSCYKQKMADEIKVGDDTIFGKIIRGEIPADFVYKDDKCVAFKDINPVAPTHILIVPIKPIPSISKVEEEDKELLGHLLLTAKKIGEEQGLVNGYRLVINNGEYGQQSVEQLHIHLIGGKQLSWPPC